MNIKNYIHIGFGKCASTKLQNDILPHIAKLKNLTYCGANRHSNKNRILILQKKILRHLSRVQLGLDIDKIKMGDNYLISNEELSSYRDPENIEEFSKKNLQAFGKDTHIILIIREPYSWLSSIYTQLNIYEKPFQRPENFFLKNSEYSIRLPYPKFNIDKFSYNNIIDLYKEKFNNFTYIKMEHLDDFKAFGNIFDLKDEQIDVLKKIYKKKYYNKGMTNLSYNLFILFYKLLNYFGLSLTNKYTNEVYLKRIRSDFVTKKQNRKSRNKFRRIFNYKIILQVIINKIFPNNKFIIDFEKLDYINIKKFETEYSKLENYKTFTK